MTTFMRKVVGAVALGTLLLGTGDAGATAKIDFKTLPQLHRVSASGRFVPVTAMDPVEELPCFGIWNLNGPVYSECCFPGHPIANAKGTAWTYVVKRNGSPQIYAFRIRKRLNKLTGDTEFLFKVKAEGDLSSANPLITGQTLEEPQTMTVWISVGDDVFLNTSIWERKPTGWKLIDKFLFM